MVECPACKLGELFVRNWSPDDTYLVKAEVACDNCGWDLVIALETNGVLTVFWQDRAYTPVRLVLENIFTAKEK